MTPPGQHMREDMQVRNFSPHTPAGPVGLGLVVIAAAAAALDLR